MNRQVLLGIAPYLALIVISALLARGLMWLSHVRFDWRRIRRLHSDQVGAVQSLSFVLTLPLFVIVMMFIVQLSQLTIAKVFVEYAAFSAARTAAVWIPSHFGPGIEPENRIGPPRVALGNEAMFDVYQVDQPSPKFNKIQYSAAMALLPICPSRETGANRNDPRMAAVPAINATLGSLAPRTTANPRIPRRVENKLAYALENTRVKLEIRHRKDEPPLAYYGLPCWFPDDEYAPNEYGWLDNFTVTVEHEFALLPGPGRLLARRATAPVGSDPQQNPGSDRVAQRLTLRNNVYRYPLSATARLGNEGKKSVLRYVQPANGNRPSTTASFATGYANSPLEEHLPTLFAHVLGPSIVTEIPCRDCQKEATP